MIKMQGLGAQSRYWGKYRGIVANTDDPKARARLKAIVPEVLGDLESGWALPCAPFAGDKVGLYTIPEKGTGVWIEFEGGDVSRPIWSGAWWADDEIPEGAVPSKRLLRTPSGHGLTFDDEAASIKLEDASGQYVELDEEGVRLVDAREHRIEFAEDGITLQVGETSISVQDGTVTISTGSETITLGDGKITTTTGAESFVISSGSITADAGGGKLDLTCGSASLGAGGKGLEATSSGTKINGTALEVA